jgi:hypothetical protein
MPDPSVDNPPWAYSRNAEGPIVVQCPYSLPAGETFVAKARYVGDRGLLLEASGASRVLAVKAALDALLAKGLLNKLPVSILNEVSDYRTV